MFKWDDADEEEYNPHQQESYDQQQYQHVYK
jgi:hypothetical protein